LLFIDGNQCFCVVLVILFFCKGALKASAMWTKNTKLVSDTRTVLVVRAPAVHTCGMPIAATAVLFYMRLHKVLYRLELLCFVWFHDAFVKSVSLRLLERCQGLAFFVCCYVGISPRLCWLGYKPGRSTLSTEEFVWRELNFRSFCTEEVVCIVMLQKEGSCSYITELVQGKHPLKRVGNFDFFNLKIYQKSIRGMCKVLVLNYARCRHWWSGAIALHILHLGIRWRWYSGRFTPGNYWVGGWLSLARGLDAVAKRKKAVA
jgi:hypothetical protein